MPFWGNSTSHGVACGCVDVDGDLNQFRIMSKSKPVFHSVKENFMVDSVERYTKSSTRIDILPESVFSLILFKTLIRAKPRLEAIKAMVYG